MKNKILLLLLSILIGNLCYAEDSEVIVRFHGKTKFLGCRFSEIRNNPTKVIKLLKKQNLTAQLLPSDDLCETFPIENGLVAFECTIGVLLEELKKQTGLES